MTLQPSSLKRGNSTIISARLTDGNNVTLTGKEIGFYVGATSIGTAMTDYSGTAVKKYTASFDAGTYVIMAYYNGSTEYGSSIVSGKLIVWPLNVTLVVDAPPVKVGTEATVATILKDENGAPVPGETTDFYLFGYNAWSKIGSSTTNSLGQTSITRTFYVAGDYRIKMVYAGSTNYNEFNATATLTINKFTTTLTIDVPDAMQRKECVLRSTLKDESDHPMQDADVDFYVYESDNWKRIGTAKTDSNGVASLNYTQSDFGTFQVKAVFNGATNYAQSTSSVANLNVAIDFTPYYINGGTIAVAIIGVAGYLVFRRRRKATPQE